MIQILNQKECKVWHVGYMFGKLFYNNSFWGKRQEDITKVIVLNSKLTRRRNQWGTKPPLIEANIDIYTASGKVIEIFTDDRIFLDICDKYTIKKDPRTYYRQQRGVE